MISLLAHSGRLGDEYGTLASLLSVLTVSKVAVVPTIVVSPELCTAYQEGGNQPDVYDSIVKDFRTEAHTQNLFLRSSVRPGIWIEDKVRVPCRASELRNSIERIYRSWSSARSSATRVQHGLGWEEGKPAVLVQEEFDNVDSILSRHAVHGSPTTATDWQDNVDSHIREFDSSCLDLVYAAEIAIRRPVQVSFITRGRHHAVVSVKEDAITERATWYALRDLYERRVISSLELLKGIQPDSLGYLAGYELKSGSSLGIVRGLGASHGIVLGSVAFRGYKRISVDRHGLADFPPVLFLDEVHPKDAYDVFDSAGVAATLGGESSHAAVRCRELGKACVVGCSSIRLNQQGRRVHLSNGVEIAEGSPVALDGRTGKIEFGEEWELNAEYVAASGMAELFGEIQAVGSPGTELEFAL